jgi:hypothetical protein
MYVSLNSLARKLVDVMFTELVNTASNERRVGKPVHMCTYRNEKK